MSALVYPHDPDSAQVAATQFRKRGLGMSLLFRIIYAAHAKGTHHKLALDALKQLTSPDAERWQRVFLKHAETYLAGSKAPDDQFKDFKNHVLHVRDGYWGGALGKADQWYARSCAWRCGPKIGKALRGVRACCRITSPIRSSRSIRRSRWPKTASIARQSGRFRVPTMPCGRRGSRPPAISS